MKWSLQFIWLLSFFSSSAQLKGHLSQEGEGREILRDVFFKQGVALTPLSPEIVKAGGGFEKTYVDTLCFTQSTCKPVWQLAQWHSKFSLEDAKLRQNSNGSLEYSNNGKTIGLFPDSSLWLQIKAVNEYSRPRRANEKWPHLLISQNFFANHYQLSKCRKLIFSMNLKLECFDKMDSANYNPALHAAHTPFFILLKNVNRQSSDFGKQIWLGVPSFDSRYHRLDVRDRVTWDKGTKTYIFKIASRGIWSDANFHDYEWHFGKADLIPHIEDALYALRNYNFQNTVLADLKLISMNFGWEVPGTFNAAIRVKNISLKWVDN